MADTNGTEQLKEEIRRARADLRNDVAELDHHLHVDVPATISDEAPLIAAGAAAVGLLIGLGGTKALKGLVVAGAAAGAAFVLLKKRQRAA